MLDLIKDISDPIVKDGVTVIALAVGALFVFIKFIIKTIHELMEKRDSETRIEKYFRQEIDAIKQEKLVLIDEHKKMLLENIEQRHAMTKLYLQIKVLKTRVVFLENILINNNISFPSLMDNFDD